MTIKMSKEDLDRLWPTFTVDMRNEIYAIAFKGLVALTASAGFTLTEMSNTTKPKVEKPKPTPGGMRPRYRNIKIHDRTFKDPAAVALFYQCTRSRVSQIIRDEGLEHLEEIFEKRKSTIIRKDDVTLVGGA